MTTLRISTLFAPAALALAFACTGPNYDNRPCASDDDCLVDEGYECIDDICAKPGDVDAGPPRAWACQLGTGAQGDDSCDCGCGDDDPDCGEDYSLAACDNNWCYVRYPQADQASNTPIPTDPALCNGDVE